MIVYRLRPLHWKVKPKVESAKIPKEDARIAAWPAAVFLYTLIPLVQMLPQKRGPRETR